MTPEELAARPTEGRFYTVINDAADKAVELMEAAWVRSQGLGPDQRARYLTAVGVEIATTYGDVAAAAAADYIRARSAADGVALAAAALTLSKTDTAYLIGQMGYALQTQTEGLTDPARHAGLLDAARRVVDKHIRRRAYRHLNTFASEAGYKVTVATEASPCGFCMGRSLQGVLPPYHGHCRCHAYLDLP